MTKKVPEVEDEPGAEERFQRGIENALKTPPKPRAAPAPKRPMRDRAD